MNDKKRALILGITGQDGSYLAEVLLEKGYEVHGLYRRSSTGNFKNIQHILGKITLHRGDLADTNSVRCALTASDPHEIYNEADQDNVDWSRETVEYSMDITAGAVGRLLETIRLYWKHSIRIFQPVTAMIFGCAPAPQNEESTLNPNSPYACAKACAYHLCRHYREAYGMFVTCGIMYNHESPRRSEEYLLHRICASAVRIADGKQKNLRIFSLNASVNVGYAREYMQCAHSLMQLDNPGDFVVGVSHNFYTSALIERAFYLTGVYGMTDSKVVVDETTLRPGPQPLLIPDITNLYRSGAYVPQTNGHNIVDMLCKYYQLNLRSNND